MIECNKKTEDDKMSDKLFQRIKELTELQGISGYERNVRHI